MEPEPWSQAMQHSRSTEPGSEGTWQTREGVKRREQVTKSRQIQRGTLRQLPDSEKEGSRPSLSVRDLHPGTHRAAREKGIGQVGAAQRDEPSAKCLSHRTDRVVGPSARSGHPVYFTGSFKDCKSFRFVHSLQMQPGPA